MKQHWVLGTVLILGGMGLSARSAVADDPLAWWRDARFGMFVHWGPSSLKGTEISLSRGIQVPVDEYDVLYKNFNPTDFDAEAWAALAKDAGMKYLVLTSKHHDGFCLWDSPTTDYDMMSTPYARDVMRPLADACKNAGIRFCTYHSIIDWHHPDYIPRGKGDTRPTDDVDFERYVGYMKGQLREIIEGYGPLGIMWFDGEWDDTWTHERGLDLYKYVKELQPDIIINNRVDKGRRGMAGVTAEGFAGDYDTPEQEVGAFNRERPWETCMTLGTQWAWKPNDSIKSFDECIRTLVQTVGGDGNLLLNVGPMADGRIEPGHAERLREMGRWLAKNGESIYGTRGGPYMPGAWGAATCKGRHVYLHLFKGTWDGASLPALDAVIQSARLLNGAQVEVTQIAKQLRITLPKEAADAVDTIVVLELDRAATDLLPAAVTLR